MSQANDSRKKGSLMQNNMQNDQVKKDLQTIPSYTCKKIDRDLVLTGKIDDPLWHNVSAVSLQDAVTGRRGRFDTSVKVLYNDRFLYVSFYCQDDYIWGTKTERNSAIYEEECVEVFVNPANTIHQYYEINLSPKNVVFDACLINPRTAENDQAKFQNFPEWNLPKMETRTFIDGQADVPGKGKSWSCEFAIPLVDLWGAAHIPPHRGDVWRINFYRIDSPAKNQREHYGWSQTGKAAFHMPWRFGFLRFN
jgi:hypothetical protein